METAHENLVPVPVVPTVDKSKLEAKSEEIDEAISTGELKEEAYTEASWQALEEALTEAKAVLADPTATQEEVNAALEALETAHENLVPVPVVPTVDKSKLEAKSEEIDEAISTGELKEEAYTEASWQALEEALTEAKAVLADPTATQEEVNAALEALETAHENLVPVPVVPTVDKSKLEAKSEEVDEAISTGELKEEAYTEASWQALEEALTEAKAVLADANATQKQVDDALAALTDAHENLVPVPTVPAVDKSKLQAKSDEIDKAIEAGTLKGSDYTVDSWKALQDAQAAAKAVLADANATQKQVDDALAALTDAHEKLVPVPTAPAVDKSKLQAKADEIDKAIEAGTLKGSDYTADSWKALQDAQAAAKAVLADADATQAEVDSALAALTDAHAKLVKEPTVPEVVNKEALQAKSDEIDEAIEAGTLKGSEYTVDSWRALQAAQAAAKAVLADPNATQAEVDSALAALLDAYAKLVKAPTSPGNGGGTVPTPVPTPTPESPIISTVDDSKVPFASATTVQSGDRTQITVKVDRDKLSGILNESKGQKLGIQVPGSGDVDIQGLTVEDLKKLADTGSSLNIEDLLAIYPIPTDQLKLNEIVSQFGDTPLSEIAVNINIKRSTEALANLAKEQVAAKGYELLVHPVEIDLTFAHNGQTNQADLLAGYAVKYIALPEGIDPNRITTGVVIKPDGTVFHVPTVVTKLNNRYFAQINDLRSYGTYSVIWNPRDLDDVKTHWAKESVNNMAARLVIEGTGNNNFTPDRVITRSEFAVFVVKGLGLMHLDVEQNKFHDVSSATWFHDAVTIANDFGIVLGYNDGAFHGDLEITREQGMAMIYRSFQLINPEASMSEDQINAVLATYGDADKVAPWAKEAVAMLISQGITEGKSEQLLDPKGKMTRAEAAALIQRLLKATQLID
ncbi:hypothetical protein J40TS1_30050 [Paenibacillus montaniterrae]|uniref:SLH domain-containing protein n=1 Tax=Paenibacillus montaniterrae TaxID=429341 RepID=A0A920CZD8_9BACL|nr:hypothetical protein J40TS1_30050 [Paenibacillus montaniterrae]